MDSKIIFSVCLVLFLLAEITTANSSRLPGPCAPTQKNSTPHNSEKLFEESTELAENALYEESWLKLLEAVDLWQKAGATDRAVTALFQAAEYHKAAARWQIALDCYQLLLKLRPAMPQLRVSALDSIARIYLLVGQLELSEDNYRQAVRIAEQYGDRLIKARLMAGLAAVCARSERVKEAGTYLEQARLFQPGEPDDKKADTLQLIGQAYYLLGQFQKAREAFEQALSLNRRVGSKPEAESILLCYLSGIHLKFDQKESALECATRGLAIAISLRSVEAQWFAQLALARAERARGNIQNSLRSYYVAFGLIEMQALYITADDLNISYLEERQNVYREFAELLLEIGNAGEAFNVIEHARSRATLDLLAEGSRSHKKQATPEQLERLKAVADTIASLSRLLKDSQPAEEKRLKLQSELDRAKHLRKGLSLEIQLGHLKQFTKPLSLKEAQATILGPDDILIEFLLADSRSNAWAITSRNVSSVSLPGRKEIEEKVLRYIGDISAEPNALYMDQILKTQKGLAKHLFDLLLGDFRQLLAAGKRVIIVPDGLLYYLPFESLISNEKYLIEDHPVVYAPSASVLGLLQQRAMNRVMAQKLDLLAFGNPAFAHNDKNPSATAQGHPANSLPPLPGSKREVLGISEFFPPNRQQIYMGKAATKDALKSEQLRKYRRVHFATHSLSDERTSARSGLVFAPGKSASENSFLQINEIADLDLECDLVVLSACRTGRGKLLRGEGIVGLARAFLYAGAQSSVVTLNSVNDVATADFMIGFYGRLSANTGIATALRQAKLEMINGGSLTRHPYYWAPFILIGASD